MPKTAPYFAALGYATLFGFSFMFTRSALAHIGPFHLLGLRFALAAFLLGALQLMGIIKINLAWADYKKLPAPGLLPAPAVFCCRNPGRAADFLILCRNDDSHHPHICHHFGPHCPQ